MPEPVVIAAYDPAWPPQFDLIRAGLARAMGDAAIDIHHVGSTAVAGLAAKPILDIDLVIASASAMPEAIARLAAAGYAYEGERGVAGRHAFGQPIGLPRHHLYVCAQDNRELARHLTFRDALRADPSLRDRYAALKQQLAARFGIDREGYAMAKTEFVERVLKGSVDD